MSHSVCPACRLRFTPGQAAGLPACPVCGGRLEILPGAAGAIGLPRFAPDPEVPQLPEAAAAALPVDPPRPGHPGPEPD